MRQIVLDTETTGLEITQGHRVIEIGCIELRDRRPTGRTFHKYLCPDREVEPGALAVHGITNEFLSTQPRFGEVVEEFLEFVREAELIIHNAAFDVGFLDSELARVKRDEAIGEICQVLDTLALARQLHPGQRNSLDALCKRYSVDNSQRDLHGALLDADLLLEVYLAMTGGQGALTLDEADVATETRTAARKAKRPRGTLIVVRATAAELQAHEQRLAALDKSSNGRTVWRTIESNA